jgi:hypothetical protein
LAFSPFFFDTIMRVATSLGSVGDTAPVVMRTV